MCGIAGIINKKGFRPDEKEIQIMNDKMSHRGPDAEGVYIHRSIGLGHRRLSIIGLSENGSQPMCSHDKRYTVSFNGEIYNYIELRNMLRKTGACFKTDTDTEVILEAYRYWGINCTKYFNGMWSIALYDKIKNQIFISRDRFGVKPLYICETENEFIFASEIKCITAVRPEEKTADVIQIARFLRGIQEDMDEHTFYKNIHNFPKSYNMIYNVDTNEKKYQEYWRVDIAKFQKKWKCKNPYKKFLELLEDSIKIRLRADVKIGASLSGGLDSSTIVGIINKKFKTNIHTFSSIYNEKDCNEKEFIDCMNRHAHTIPHSIYPDKSKDIMQDMKDLVYYHDGPCYSASPYSGYCVYRGVGNRVKVLLDGQGADELFGGYLLFYNSKLEELLRQGTFLSKMKAAYLVFCIQNEWPGQTDFLNNELLLKLLGAKGYWQFKKKEGEKEVPSGKGTGLKFLQEFRNVPLDNEYQMNRSIINELDKELYLQLQYKMLPRILHDVDRNSMARSLEVRLPFLDYRLVEFSYTLKDDDKIRGIWTKYIMRQSCKKYLPKKIYSRKNKMGFPAPFGKWMCDDKYKSDIKKYIDEFKERNIVTAHSLEQIYQEHLSGQKCWADQLFRIMILEIWLQNEIDKKNKKWIFTTE